MEDLRIKLEKIDDYRWVLPKQGSMLVPGMIFSDENMLKQIFSDEAPKQVMNAACLPGIVGHSMAMPDIHWGYGLPIGGVIATDVNEGIISPGGVGSDINCGVRSIKTELTYQETKNKIKELVGELFRNVPCGIGSSGRINLSEKEVKRVLRDGSQWALEQGYGWNEDCELTEDGGCLEDADTDVLSKRALDRGKDQLGTLGAGNHFLELQVVETIFDEDVARAFGLFTGQLCVMVHCGSRGLGYQVCDDHLNSMGKAVQKYHIELPDRQLACAPLNSPEGKEYLAAMRAAANYAYANRQCIMHWIRQSFENILGNSAERMGMHLLYDVTHNTAKIEEYEIDGKLRTVCVHRKGATRSFPKGHPAVPDRYRNVGQPVIIPGDMGRFSYVLVGGASSMEHSFGSTCHGAGRLMSRNQAIKRTKGRAINRELEDKGIWVQSRGKHTLQEEAPEAYKNIDNVVSIVHAAGLSHKVARLKPVGVVKG